MTPLASLQSELVLKLDEIQSLCREYSYAAVPTLILRHEDGAKASLMVGVDSPSVVVLLVAELGETGNLSEMSVRDAAIRKLTGGV